VNASVRALLRGLWRRLSLLASRALVVKADDSGRCQTVQVRLLDGEVRDGIERVQAYGLTSVPNDATGNSGADAVVIFPGGGRTHGIAVVVGDRRYRLRALAKGEVALHDDLGQVVHLKRGGIVVTSLGTLEATAVGPATITAPSLVASDGLPVPIWSIEASAAGIVAKAPTLIASDGLPVPVWSVTAGPLALTAVCGLGTLALTPASATLACAPSFVLVTAAGVQIHGPTMTENWN
jgi:phage baseplate assembly protein V